MDLKNGFKVIYEKPASEDKKRTFCAAASNEYPSTNDKTLVTFEKGALNGKTVYEHEGVLYAVENSKARFDENGSPVGDIIFDFNTAFDTTEANTTEVEPEVKTEDEPVVEEPAEPEVPEDEEPEDEEPEDEQTEEG